MPEKSNALHSEPQWVDLNVHVHMNLLAIRHVQCQFTTWVRAASRTCSSQSAKNITWQNALIEFTSAHNVGVSHSMIKSKQGHTIIRYTYTQSEVPPKYVLVYSVLASYKVLNGSVLHPTILDPRDPGAGKIMKRFQQECTFLGSIRHPNIVQYLGMTRDPESRLPVLLMELLDESLTKMLERSQQSLAYCIQVNICHDIALAVAYLHSNDIIHRDLSSNNVLMIAGRRAKVTDFGMSKLTGEAPGMTPLTMCPGTLAYMPPEALREPLRYTKKLDCFSEGVIMIQVCTRLWPEPGPRTQIIKDSRSPMGVIEMPVSKTERRKDHIDLIDPNHALLLIAKECIQFQEMDRPSSEELCQKLADLMESRKYRESMHHEIQSNSDQLLILTRQLHKKDNDIFLKTRQVQDAHRALQLKDNEICERDRLLQQKERQLQEERASRDRQLHKEITSRERQLQLLNQQLEEQKQVIAALKRQVEQLQPQLSQQSLPPQDQVGGTQMILKWRDGGEAPLKMCRGAALVDRNVVYFMKWNGEVCSYSTTSKKWSELPRCPYMSCGLAVVNDQMTTIGGCKEAFTSYTSTNKLLNLSEYKEIFPPMPTERVGTTVVASKEHLIVAGGACRVPGADTVEVMDTKTLVWSTVASLPHPYGYASGTISGDRLYILGGMDDKGRTKSVLTCSLTELLQSSSSSSSSSIWHRVADAPAYWSTCAAINGELLAVGGCDEDNKPTAAIHKYNPITNSWDLISNMSTARYHCLVAVLPTNEMMVVGGSIDIICSVIDNVEIAYFSLP